MINDPSDFEKRALAWFRNHRELTSFRAAVVDFNGCLRGKRLPMAQAPKVLKGDMRMPLSLAIQDIWGRDVKDNPMVNEGDADGICRPTGRGPLTVDWLDTPTAFLPMWFFHEDGRPSLTDPRQALAAVVARYQALGLRPVVATELEFYLVDPRGVMPAAPVSPMSGKALMADGVLSLDDVDHFDAFFSEVYAACEENDIPVDTAIAEGGPGQFEINFVHSDDPLKVADDTLFFKRLVRGIARKHALAATFMAKPFLESTGSGFHVHFSLIDQAGRNLFDDGTAKGSDTLRSAVAGLIAAMEEQTLVFAPHLNSYRRLKPGSHAPTGLCWAYENRFAAIRIPGGPNAARRLEHRVSGADANPYMVIAAILGAALDGIEARAVPPPPVTGNAYDLDLEQLPGSWGRAIDAFREGERLGNIFAPELRELYAAGKAQEWETFAERMSEFEVQSYLEVV